MRIRGQALTDNPKAYKPAKPSASAKVARRGGNAIVAVTTAPKPGRIARVRAGGR